MSGAYSIYSEYKLKMSKSELEKEKIKCGDRNQWSFIHTVSIVFTCIYQGEKNKNVTTSKLLRLFNSAAAVEFSSSKTVLAYKCLLKFWSNGYIKLLR